MKRRNFLKATGAFAAIEFDTDAASGDGSALTMRHDVRSTADDGVPLGRLSSSLPSPATLVDGSDYAVSLTRLDLPVVTLTGDVLSEAAAYGTVFTTRRAIDVVFGISGDELRDRLRDEGYEQMEPANGWTVFCGRKRARHRLAGVTDSVGVFATGPVFDAVRTDLVAGTAAVDRTETRPDGSTQLLRTMVDKLGEGTHVSVDLTPDTSQAPASVVATGERIAIRGGETLIRAATLFDSGQQARVTEPRSLETTWRFDGLQVSERSTWRDGRAIVEELTLPTDQFLTTM